MLRKTNTKQTKSTDIITKLLKTTDKEKQPNSRKKKGMLHS
jgi:hypothetical protein